MKTKKVKREILAPDQRLRRLIDAHKIIDNMKDDIVLEKTRRGFHVCSTFYRSALLKQYSQTFSVFDFVIVANCEVDGVIFFADF